MKSTLEKNERKQVPLKTENENEKCFFLHDTYVQSMHLKCRAPKPPTNATHTQIIQNTKSRLISFILIEVQQGKRVAKYKIAIK